MALNEIYIYGASGHGKVIADIIHSCGYTVAGWIDDKPAADTYSWNDFLVAHPRGNIALGIGNNDSREAIFLKVAEAGYTLPTLIHPSAIISKSATIDQGSIIMPLAVVNADTTIGIGCIINSGAIVEHDCILENYVHISPNAALAGGVHIQNNTHIGIGANIIQNIMVEEHSIIAAGSVVVNPIPNYSLAAGVPAIIKKRLYKPI